MQIGLVLLYHNTKKILYHKKKKKKASKGLFGVGVPPLFFNRKWLFETDSILSPVESLEDISSDKLWKAHHQLGRNRLCKARFPKTWFASTFASKSLCIKQVIKACWEAV